MIFNVNLIFTMIIIYVYLFINEERPLNSPVIKGEERMADRGPETPCYVLKIIKIAVKTWDLALDMA